MRIKDKLSGVQVSVPDALADELLGKGTHQTLSDYDESQRAAAEAERDRLAVLAGVVDEDDPDNGEPTLTVAERRAQKAAERAAAKEAAEKEAAEKAAADAAANAGN